MRPPLPFLGFRAYESLVGCAGPEFGGALRNPLFPPSRDGDRRTPGRRECGRPRVRGPPQSSSAPASGSTGSGGSASRARRGFIAAARRSWETTERSISAIARRLANIGLAKAPCSRGGEEEGMGEPDPHPVRFDAQARHDTGALATVTKLVEQMHARDLHTPD